MALDYMKGSQAQELIDRCSQELAKYEDKYDVRVKSLREHVKQAKKCYNEMSDKSGPVQRGLATYRAQVNQLNVLEEIWRSNMGSGYITDMIEESYGAYQQQKKIIMDNKYLETVLGPVAKRGLQALSNIRKDLTNQEIIYAVPYGTNNNVKVSFVKEDEFLDLAVGREYSQKNQKTFLRGIGEDFSGGYLSINYEDAEKFAEQSGAIEVTNKTVLSQIWDRATGRAMAMENLVAVVAQSDGQRTSKNIVKNFNNFRNKKIKYLNAKKHTMSAQSMTLTQHGDFSSQNKNVLIQVKAPSKNTRAGVNIASIYSGLRTVVRLFDDNKEIKEKDVKEFFSIEYANGKKVSNFLFDEGNTYARNQITEMVKAWNKKT